MKDRLVDFVDGLRRAGVRPSPAETLDAVAAVAAAGVEREVLREALAASLVKDHAERPTFDDLFDRYFVLPGRTAGKKKRPRPGDEGSGVGPGGEGEGGGRQRPEDEKRQAGKRDAAEPRRAEPAREPQSSAEARRLARRRRLREMPFRDMGPDDVAEAQALVEELARRFRSRWSRRLHRSRRGRLDMRRTIRRSTSRGGVPVELLLRRPRPGKSDLLALVDLSYSTATAARFLLSLLAPARPYFRRVTLLGYVDAPVEISIESGHVVPHEPLDLHARSDFGRVLRDVDERYGPTLGRNTVLLVLGDARNNRRPPRADLLRRCRDAAKALLWLNPEPEERWNTGDSVIAAYGRYADVVLPAWNLRTLEAGIAQLGKRAI